MHLYVFMNKDDSIFVLRNSEMYITENILMTYVLFYLPNHLENYLNSILFASYLNYTTKILNPPTKMKVTILNDFLVL